MLFRSRRAGIKLSTFADVAAPGVLLAQAVGRWGNWFNQELFGGPTDLPWGLEIDPNNTNFPDGAAPGTLFHPTFLYESLWNLAGVALLLVLDRRFRLRGGRLFWLYAAFYTAGRVWIEMLRIDDAEMVTILGVTQRLNVWTSILILLVSIGMFIFLSIRARRQPESSPMLPGHELSGSETTVSSNNSPVDNKNETDSRNVKSGSQSRDARASVAETKNEASKPQRPEDSGPAT